jgi:hypothetical protein
MARKQETGNRKQETGNNQKLKAGAVGVVGYGGVDIKGQSQGCSTLSTGNAWSGPRSDRSQKIF